MEDEAFDFKAIVRVWNSHYKWEGRKNKEESHKEENVLFVLSKVL